MTLDYVGSTFTLNTNTLVSADKKALLPVTITTPISRPNLEAVLKQYETNEGYTLAPTQVESDPAAHIDALFKVLQMQKQLKEPAGRSTCINLVPGTISASSALQSGIMTVTGIYEEGIVIKLKFFVADDANGARIDRASGNLIVGDGEENRQINDPLWATYKASPTPVAADGGGGCSMGWTSLLFFALVPLADRRRRR